jgi:hypothetical protein
MTAKGTTEARLQRLLRKIQALAEEVRVTAERVHKEPKKRIAWPQSCAPSLTEAASCRAPAAMKCIRSRTRSSAVSKPRATAATPTKKARARSPTLDTPPPIHPSRGLDPRVDGWPGQARPRGRDGCLNLTRGRDECPNPNGNRPGTLIRARGRHNRTAGSAVPPGTRVKDGSS